MITFSDDQGHPTELTLDIKLLSELLSSTDLGQEGTPVNPINLDPFTIVKSDNKILDRVPSLPKGSTVKARLTNHCELSHNLLYGVIRNVSSGSLGKRPLMDQLSFEQAIYKPLYAQNGEIFVPLNAVESSDYYNLFNVNNDATSEIYFSYGFVLAFNIKVLEHGKEITRRLFGKIDPLVKISTGG